MHCSHCVCLLIGTHLNWAYDPDARRSTSKALMETRRFTLMYTKWWHSMRNYNRLAHFHRSKLNLVVRWMRSTFTVNNNRFAYMKMLHKSAIHTHIRSAGNKGLKLDSLVKETISVCRAERHAQKICEKLLSYNYCLLCLPLLFCVTVVSMRSNLIAAEAAAVASCYLLNV